MGVTNLSFNLIHLRTFYLVARYRSFSKAGELLHLSQPAVSRQIQALEKDLDLDLFAVRGRRVELSDAGRLLFNYAEQILNQVQDAERVLQSLKNLETGEIRIAASNTPGNYLLPGPIALFTRRHPGLQTQLRVGNTSTVWRQVRSGEAELGFVGAPPPESGFFNETVFRDELLLVASPKHPLVDRETVGLQDLAGQTLLVREEGSATRQVITRHLTELGLDRLDLVPMGHPEAIKRAVEAGMGLTFLPRITMLCELAGNRLQVLNTPYGRIERPLLMISIKDRQLSPSALAFRAFLHRHNLRTMHDVN